MDEFGEIIHSYSRAQAIEDGALVEASQELLANAGIMVPVAYTPAVYADCIAWDERDQARRGVVQDQAGREWDVLWMFRRAARAARDRAALRFRLFRVPRDRDLDEATEVELYAATGHGDDGEMVITIMSSADEL